MLYFELLKETISVIGYSVLLSLICYVLLAWLLWKQNKYNLKNAWFILGSIVLVPFLFFEMSFYLAAEKVNNCMVEPAKQYACSFVSKIDTYSETIPTFVNGVVENVVAEKTENIKQKVSESVTSAVSVVQDSLKMAINNGIAKVADSLSHVVYSKIVESAVDTLAESMIKSNESKVYQIIDKTTCTIELSAEHIINKSTDILPTNIVGELKKKFPSLSLFLTDKGIDGDTGEEIVASMFNKVTLAITQFKHTRILSLLKCILIFAALSLLSGWCKQKRISRKKEISSIQKEDNDSDFSA